MSDVPVPPERADPFPGTPRQSPRRDVPAQVGVGRRGPSSQGQVSSRRGTPTLGDDLDRPVCGWKELVSDVRRTGRVPAHSRPRPPVVLLPHTVPRPAPLRCRRSSRRCPAPSPPVAPARRRLGTLAPILGSRVRRGVTRSQGVKGNSNPDRPRFHSGGDIRTRWKGHSPHSFLGSRTPGLDTRGVRRGRDPGGSSSTSDWCLGRCTRCTHHPPHFPVRRLPRGRDGLPDRGPVPGPSERPFPQTGTPVGAVELLCDRTRV